MNYKRIAAILAAVAIIGSSSYATADTLLFNDVVTVSAAVTLRKNSTGSSVTQLQNNLVALRYLDSSKVTGKYDSATETAVKKFQNDFNLDADGVAGSKTLGLIESLVNGTASIIEVKSTLLNVRASADSHAKILTTVKQGQKYVTAGETKDSEGTTWYKINTKTATGYVCSDYVTVTSPQAVEKVDPTATKGIVRITGEVLNVRASTSTSSKKLYTVKAGQTYHFTNMKTVSGEKWYYITVNSSTKGWILGKWAVPIESETEAKDVPKSGKLKVVVDILQVRASTSTSSKRLYTTKFGEVYTYSNVKKVNNINWYYIKVNSSVSGWVLGSMVSVESTTPTTTTSNTTETTAASQTTAQSKQTTKVVTLNSGKLKVTVSTLNVRKSTSTSSKKLYTVKKNQVFSYSNVKKVNGVNWYYIKVNNSVSGWVLGSMVKATPNTTVVTETTKASTTTKATTAADPNGGTLTVTVDVLNVREGASTSSKKLYSVKKNQTYSYSKTKKVDSNTWYYIKVNNSISGWVLGTMVKATPNATQTTAKTTKTTTSTTAADPDSGKLTVTVDALNVREDASTSSKKLYTAKKNQTYSYSKTKKVGDNTWYYIKVNNSISGWVLGTMVKATPNTTQTTATTKAAEPDKNAGRLKITATSLNVRSEANKTSRIITTVKKGKEYEYSDVKTVDGEKWYYITVSGSQKGWVNGGYVSLLTDPTTTTAATTTTAVTEPKETTASSSTQSTTEPPSDVSGSGSLIVTATLLNVRAEPSAQAAIIATVKVDQECEFSQTRYAEGITWYYIKVSEVRSGWVMGTYVKVLDEEVPEQQPGNQSENKGTLTVTGTTVNVRTGPGTNYDKIQTVKKDQKFDYTEEKDGWYHIELSNEKDGWIKGDYVNATAAPALMNAAPPAATTTTTTTASSTQPVESDVSSQPAESEEPSTTTESTKTTTGKPASPTAAATVSRSVMVGTVKCSSKVNVRKGAGTKYASLGSLKNGATVVIVSKGSSWHKIEYGSGYGYVSASYIKDIKTKTESVAMSYKSDYYYIQPGESIDLGRKVSGSTVKYVSSDTKNCPVTDKGVATGVTCGLYEIKATSGSSSASTCVVVLKDANKDIQPLQISEAGTHFIAEWEGGGTVMKNGETAYYPYKDMSGYWTIGFGHAKTTAASKKWSEERAKTEFNNDIEKLIGAEYKLTAERPYLTEEGAKLLLNADLNKGEYVKSVSNWAVRNGVKLNQVQFDALVSFCYNIGTPLWDSDSTKFYLKSAIISHRSGDEADPNQIIEGFCRYHKSDGKHVAGLWYRRRNEAELFLTGDYEIDRTNKFKLPSGISWS